LLRHSLPVKKSQLRSFKSLEVSLRPFWEITGKWVADYIHTSFVEENFNCYVSNF
jgi:hypothetical protein